MATLHISADSLPQARDSQIISASSLRLNLPQPPKSFIRHGWQSWTLTHGWIRAIRRFPSAPRSSAPRTKILATPSTRITSAPGSAQWNLAKMISFSLGALDLSGRVELDGSALHGFYEDGQEGQWLVARGKEDEVFSEYVQALERRFGKGRFAKAPRVWCSWYSLYGWVNERVFLRALHDFGDMPFDVFQLDDGWQLRRGRLGGELRNSHPA